MKRLRPLLRLLSDTGLLGWTEACLRRLPKGRLRLTKTGLLR